MGAKHDTRKEDRASWESQRARQRTRVSRVRQGLQAAGGALFDMADRATRSRMDAAHQVAARAAFDQGFAPSRVANRNLNLAARTALERADAEIAQGATPVVAAVP